MRKSIILAVLALSLSSAYAQTPTAPQLADPRLMALTNMVQQRENEIFTLQTQVYQLQAQVQQMQSKEAAEKSAAEKAKESKK